jgi:hypothetical protein
MYALIWSNRYMIDGSIALPFVIVLTLTVHAIDTNPIAICLMEVPP